MSDAVAGRITDAITYPDTDSEPVRVAIAGTFVLAGGLAERTCDDHTATQPRHGGGRQQPICHNGL